MSRKSKNWSRREFLHKSATAGAVLSLAPLGGARLALAQSTARTRITIAHGVGV